MKILAIDTSTLTASAAVIVDDVVFDEHVRNTTHSEELMPMVARVA